eukprot:792098-Rhodomonas_salina.1
MSRIVSTRRRTTSQAFRSIAAPRTCASTQGSASPSRPCAAVRCASWPAHTRRTELGQRRESSSHDWELPTPGQDIEFRMRFFSRVTRCERSWCYIDLERGGC